MIKTIHIEDEIGVVKLLKNLLEEHFPDTIALCGNAGNISEAIALINNVNPQLVYLDIQLKNGTTFELLEKLGGHDFEIIFITAYNEYAIKAFKHSAIDYILKPIDIEELKTATLKAVKRIKDSNYKLIESETIKYLKANLGTKKMGIPVADGILFINIDDIVHIEAKGSYSIFTFVDKTKITATKSLKEMESLLPESSFLRVHNSWVIHLKYLKKYYRGKNSYMEMEDGSIIAVSVRKKSTFLDMLGG